MRSSRGASAAARRKCTSASASAAPRHQRDAEIVVRARGAIVEPERRLEVRQRRRQSARPRRSCRRAAPGTRRRSAPPARAASRHRDVRELLALDRTICSSSAASAARLRQHLQSELRHFVGRPRAGAHADRRVVRVVDVRLRVVERVAHRQRRAARQRDRRRVAIVLLPVKVPLLDVKQRLHGAVGQRRGDEHLLAEVVRVRIHAQQIDRHRQLVGVGDHVVALARPECRSASSPS